MNFTVHSDQAVNVTVHMQFVQGLVFEFRMLLSGYGPASYCVVGRTPCEVVTLELEYDGGRFAHPIEADGDNLKPIYIYGKRDPWSQLLREAAMRTDD